MKDLKKNMLVVVPRMPYPLNSGGRIAIYEAIKSLSKRYDLSIIIIDDNPANVQYVPEIKKFSDDVTFYTKKRYHFALNAISGLLTGLPLQVGYFKFPEVQQIVSEKVKKADIFFAFMIRTTGYGLSLPVKKVHYAIDSMYLNYNQSQQNTKSLLWKLIYKIEVPFLFKAEKKQVKEYDLTTFVNKEDADFWKDYGKVATMPHGIDKKALLHSGYNDIYKNVVVFIGRMDYQPNIEAVLWFCNNVLQNLSKDIELWIVGGFPKPQIQALESQYGNVKVLGFVDDPEIIMRSAICTVAPMQSGGGLQTKILLAMALESIVVSSSLPIKAIDNAADNVNILVRDDPGRFADSINDIYKYPDNYAHIKRNGKTLIADHYELEILEKKLFNLLNEI